MIEKKEKINFIPLGGATQKILQVGECNIVLEKGHLSYFYDFISEEPIDEYDISLGYQENTIFRYGIILKSSITNIEFFRIDENDHKGSMIILKAFGTDFDPILTFTPDEEKISRESYGKIKDWILNIYNI